MPGCLRVVQFAWARLLPAAARTSSMQSFSPRACMHACSHMHPAHATAPQPHRSQALLRTTTSPATPRPGALWSTSSPSSQSTTALPRAAATTTSSGERPGGWPGMHTNTAACLPRAANHGPHSQGRLRLRPLRPLSSGACATCCRLLACGCRQAPDELASSVWLVGHPPDGIVRACDCCIRTTGMHRGPVATCTWPSACCALQTTCLPAGVVLASPHPSCVFARVCADPRQCAPVPH
jgi:hypothetical protein